MKILVIDDSEGMRKFLRDLIEEKTDHQVLLAKDGLEGIEVVKKNADNLDLVITDRQMPGGMLGEEVVRFVKSHYPHLGVVLMSSDLDSTVALVAKAAGADMVIEKAPGMVEKIKELLGRRVKNVLRN